MDIILLLVRIALFGVFALSASAKLVDRQGTRSALRDFGVPAALATPLGILLPAAELLVASHLLFANTAWYGAWGAFLLLSIFIGAMIFHIAKGNAPDCHCFGQIQSKPVGRRTLIRNLAIVLLALLLIGQGKAGQGADLGSTTVESVLAFGLLTAGVLLILNLSYLVKLFNEQKVIRERLDEIEARGGFGKNVERKGAGDPADGLPIGAPMPRFELQDPEGNTYSSEKLLSEGKPLLLIFVTPECGPCLSLAPDIDKWQIEFASRLRIVIVSSGSRESNLEKFGSRAQILRQSDSELGDRFYAKWTPTAVFVDARGRIASHNFAGDTAIRELAGRLYKADLEADQVFFVDRGKAVPAPKISQPVAEFELELPNGAQFGNADLRDSDHLLVFLAASCQYCGELVQELKKWESSQHANSTKLIIFSDADGEAFEKRDLRSPVLRDPGLSVSKRLGMQGAPSAILVDRDGVIISETAVGVSNVLALLGLDLGER